MHASYPKSRAEASPPGLHEVAPLIERFWHIRVVNVERANSRCVFFVDTPDKRVVFRANPGWDGPLPPATIVRFIAHLSDAGASVPGIIPATDKRICIAHGDCTLSLETLLQGDSKDRVHHLHDVGQALARVHTAATGFGEFPPADKPVQSLMDTHVAKASAFPIKKTYQHALTALREHIQARWAGVLDKPVPWILCRGDVRSANTVVSPAGKVQFTDFSSAHFGPALMDLVMIHTQWLVGQGWRELTAKERAEFLSGYHQKRPLTEAEWTLFPPLAATYYAHRLCELDTKWEPNSSNRPLWDLERRILDLPDQAIKIGTDALALLGR